jgi:hypothetical protein
MKKDLAVLVGGEYREFESCFPSWRFLNSFSYDLFFSTWTTTGEHNPSMGVNFQEDVSVDRIHRVVPSAIVDIEPFTTNNGIDLRNKTIYHWKKLFQMINRSDYVYEYTLLLRPDIFLTCSNFENYIKSITGDYIYGLGPISSHRPPISIYLNDCLFLGKTSIMYKIFSSLPYFYLDYRDIHYNLGKIFLNTDVYVDPIPLNVLDYVIFRSSMRGNEHLSLQELKTISAYWWSKKHPENGG